jgi:hypothetical protein
MPSGFNTKKGCKAIPHTKINGKHDMVHVPNGPYPPIPKAIIVDAVKLLI